MMKMIQDLTHTLNNWLGTKLFSYKQGSGVNDTVLGFPFKL